MTQLPPPRRDNPHMIKTMAKRRSWYAKQAKKAAHCAGCHWLHPRHLARAALRNLTGWVAR